MTYRITRKSSGLYSLQREVIKKTTSLFGLKESIETTWEPIMGSFSTVEAAELYLTTELNFDINEVVVATYSSNVKYPNP